MNAAGAVISPREGFAECARTYDRSLNPVAALNQRILRSLLPIAESKTVVDLGCGTGAMLQLWRGMRPRQLVGLDLSGEMLRVASGIHPVLINADCCAIPLRDAAADIATCCLSLGYFSDLSAFACELARVIRPGGSALISELHPDTAERFAWKRSFDGNGSAVNIVSRVISIPEVRATFADAGLHADMLLEVPFGNEEQSIFGEAGRSEAFERFNNFPAIYVLRLRKAATAASPHMSLIGARVALNGQTSVAADLALAESNVQFIGWTASHDSAQALDLSGYILLPGLINAHDHLEFALFPRLGRGPYRNSREWAEDIYRPADSPIREHLLVPKWARLWWGGIRNLLAGVTTVCHHNPYDDTVFSGDFPVRVVRECGWAHSLPFDPELLAKLNNTQADWPFAVHLAEGVDRASAEELGELDRIAALDHRTLVVHGTALSDDALALLDSRNAGLVWCPGSNHFLFHRSLHPSQVATVHRAAMGSDSPLTAAGDFLDEVRFANRLGAGPRQLYELSTTRANRALMLRCGEGQLLPGSIADLIAMRDTGLEPANRLVELSYRDVELAIVAGKVRLVSDQLKARLPEELTRPLRLLAVNGTRRWISAPVEELLSVTRESLGPDITMHGRALTQ